MESTHQQWTDEDLLEALNDQRRADAGIRFLYRAHFGSLSNYVTTNNGSSDDAQDIFQEVVVSFVYLVRGGKFRGESSVKTFLYAMNRNLWLNELKRRGRANLREKKFEEEKFEHGDERIEKAMESREATKQLLTIVDKLGESCKKILLLYYFENRSMKEILDETAFENEQVVRNKKYKCLKKLEELIGAEKNLFQQLKNLFHG